MDHRRHSTPPAPTHHHSIHAPLLVSVLLLTLVSAASSRAAFDPLQPFLPQTNPTTAAPRIFESVDELPVDLHVRGDILVNTFISKMWHDTGCIMAGRLILDRSVSLHSRTAVWPDGTFCAAVYPSRKLVFYAHGYEPLVLTQPADPPKSIVWYGDLTMARVPAADLAQVKGIAPADSKNADASVTVRLSLAEPPEIWEDSGDEGSSPRVKPLVATKTLRHGEAFTFTGLSPLPYILAIQQSGGVDRTIPLTPKRGETIDVGSLILDQATIYTFRSIARTRPAGGQWQPANPPATTKVACNGNATFHFTETRDSLRNKLDIRLLPREKEVVAMFYFAPGQRSFFHDLGTMPVQDPAQLAEAERQATPANRTGTVALQKGHTYFFTVSNVNGVDAQCLFRVE